MSTSISDDKGYEVSPWELRWRGLDVAELERTESTFALSNGHIGLRGTLEEGNHEGFQVRTSTGFESRPIPYGEGGYGYPEAGQTLVNVTDGKIIRLLVADEPLDVRYGTATSHERVLDFRSGTLRRVTEWTSPTGRRVRIATERLVSFTQRAVAAIRYEVTPLDEDLQLVVQSDLLANEPIAANTPGEGLTLTDTRLGADLDTPLVADFASAEDYRAVLVHHTRRSGLRVAAAMDHEIQVDNGLRTSIGADEDLARLTAAAAVPQGSTLKVTKYLAYGWSSQRSVPALRAQVDAALAGALQTGWDGLLREQRGYLDSFWETGDIELEGDPDLQQAVRFALFHLLQAGARGESRPIPAKGLSSPGYDGHSFWDMDTFVLQMLTYTVPEAARDALRWRHSILDKARERAKFLGQKGASFPWRTVDGDECSPYWPAGTAAFHINADVANAVSRYITATQDTDFEVEYGVELLVETARLWSSLGHHDPHGGFRIDGVTGPDEYTSIVDNNVYTNLMAQQNLVDAADICERHPDVAEKLEVLSTEIIAWRKAAEKMVIPYDEILGVHPQSERFTEHDEWDWAGTPHEGYPLYLHYPYFDLYRKQVIKQADLVLAMHLRGDAFTPEQKARNMAYYEQRTARDSSLSPCTQAVMAAEVGDLQLAYDYFAETALMDLHDLHDNVSNGLHIASMAGTWQTVVAGFGGMRDYGRRVTFAPRLPSQLSRFTFRMSILGSRLAVEVTQKQATYRLLAGDPLDIAHHGKKLIVSVEQSVTLPIPDAPQPPKLRQPIGREPARRDQYPLKTHMLYED